MSRCVLVAGALGLVGRAALEHFARAGVAAIGLSRRQPDFATQARFVPADLTDRDGTAAALAPVAGAVTHLAYAALHERPALVRGWREAEQVETNLAMLRNLLDALAAGGAPLRHVTLLQGTKAYGAHLGPIPVPARESLPRHMPPNFYFEQEDLVRQRAAAQGWHFTVLRPQIVAGFALASPMNVVAALGCFAAISRHLGLPLRYPGGEPRLLEMTDARLLGRAVDWAGTAESAADQVFNVTNGDSFLWPDLWARTAETFGRTLGPPQPMRLAPLMADKAPLWDEVVRDHGLQTYALADLVPSWEYLDFTLGYGTRPNPVVLSTIKIRQAGFADCIDTEESVAGWLRELQDRRILPC